jgi:hypothetical protein
VIADIADTADIGKAKTGFNRKGHTEGHKGWEVHTQKSRLAAGSLHNVVRMSFGLAKC